MSVLEMVSLYFLSPKSSGRPKKNGKKVSLPELKEIFILAAIAVPVGIIVGLSAVVFRGLLSLTHNFFFLDEFSLAYEGYQHVFFEHGWLVFLVPALGGLIVGIILKFGGSEAKGDGVPEVMYSVAKKRGRIKPKVGYLKIITSAITIGSGGSAGREGPMVQIGASGASSVGQFLGVSDEKLRILVGCGAAAGIAATFDAPIAGVIFALELILLEFKTRSFVPLVIASVIATLITHAIIGPSVSYPIHGISDVYILRSNFELPLYLLLGVMAGFASLFFVKFFYRVEGVFKNLKIKDYMRPMMGGLLLGITGLLVFRTFGNYFILGMGYNGIMMVLQPDGISEQVIYTGIKLALFLALLMFLKMLATSLTLGSGGSGGVFAPSLWMGAMLGASFGVVVNMAFPGIAAPFSAYALVGMAAFFAGASRATLTAIIILFELTGTYDIILPLMFACVIADAVSRAFSRDTIYTTKTSRMGVHYSYDREMNILETYTVGEVMERAVDCIVGDASLDSVSEKMLTTGHGSFPWLDQEGVLCGIVTHRDVDAALKEGKDGSTPLSEFRPECQPVVAYPDENLEVILERMAETDHGQIPVVDREDSTKLVGLITQKDILRIYRTKAKEKEDHWKWK